MITKTILIPALAAGMLTTIRAQMTDRFADRPSLSGFQETLTADTTSATLDADEPRGMHGGDQNRSVWAQWTAPDNGWVSIDTAGSFPRAILAIYTGNSLPGLETIARAHFVSLTTPASTRFPVSRGTSYQIALDGDSNSPSQSSGLARLNIRFNSASQPPGVPGADRFAMRQQLAGTSALGVANNECASVDAFQPLHTGRANRDVWWEWTAPATGTVVIDTLESAVNTVLVVYSGIPVNDPPWNDLHMIARNDDVPNSRASRVSFQTEAGRTYQIAVGGSTTSPSVSRGNILLRLALTPNSQPAGVPGTDRFAERGQLSGAAARGVANNEYAIVRDIDQPPHTGRAVREVWWEWTAPATGTVVIDTLESTINTVLVVYSGIPANDPPWNDLDMIARNDDVPNSRASRVAFQTEAGRTYQIVVGGSTTSPSVSRGNISLNLALTPNTQPVGVPGTDAFIHRPDLAGTRATGLGCNTFATREASEVVPSGDEGRSLWWSWTAPASGEYAIDTSGSEVLLPSLRIYTGVDIAALQSITFNTGVPGATWSAVRLQAVRGTTYQIRVDSTRVSMGNIVLNLGLIQLPEIEVLASASSQLIDGRSALDFGNVRRGTQSAARVITIRNAGTAPLTNLSLRVSPSGGSQFAVGHLSRISLNPGQSTSFTIRFRPSSPGLITANLAITSNDRDENPFDIRLNGTGW